MQRRIAQGLLKKLTENGHSAYLVGGCVRDLLLGRAPNDFDITTSARPEQVMALFGEKAIPTGLQHGTVTVREQGEAFEVTTFRIDGTYSDGRHPNSVSFADTVEEDLARRDFTVNAMAMDADGKLTDPFGGQDDLRRKMIRCVGQPECRFQEDALRILRALRFAAVLDFAIEAQTAEAIHTLAPLLRQIAAERILSEMNRLLTGPGCGRILREYPDVVGIFVPELLPCVGFDQQNIHHCCDVYTHTVYAVEQAPADAVLRWTLLLHDIGKVKTFSIGADGQGHFYGHCEHSAAMAEEICRRLRMRRQDADTITALIHRHDRTVARTRKAIAHTVAELGEERFLQLLEVKRADNLAQAEDFRWVQREIDRAEEIYRELLRERACLHLRDLTVNGADMKALGYKGREIGTALEGLFRSVLDGELPNTREALLQAARERMLLP